MLLRADDIPALAARPDAGGVDGRAFERLAGGGYALVLDEHAVRIELRHLRRESRQLHAEVDVQADWAGAKHHKGSLSCADLNLSSQAARKSLAKYCGERAATKPAEFDWMTSWTISASLKSHATAFAWGSAPSMQKRSPATTKRAHAECPRGRSWV